MHLQLQATATATAIAAALEIHDEFLQQRGPEELLQQAIAAVILVSVPEEEVLELGEHLGEQRAAVRRVQEVPKGVNGDVGGPVLPASRSRCRWSEHSAGATVAGLLAASLKEPKN
jgi:hypothetical protein